MIVQCGQCNARFKLDDEKIKDEGVKVRCSKCKNVFTVKKESPQEEAEFDSILGQLGTSSPGLSEAPAGAQQPPPDETGSPEAGAGLAKTGEAGNVPSVSKGEDWGEVSFGAPEAGGGVAAEPAGSREFDFERFNFDETEPPAQPVSAEPSPPLTDEAGEFHFAEETAAAPTPADSAPLAAEDAGAFDFSVEPAAPHAAPSPMGSGGGMEFDFTEEPAGTEEGEAKPVETSARDDSFDFGSFGHSATAPEKGETAVGGDFSFMFPQGGETSTGAAEETPYAPHLREDTGATSPTGGKEVGGAKAAADEDSFFFGEAGEETVSPGVGAAPAHEEPFLHQGPAAGEHQAKEDFFAVPQMAEGSELHEEIPPPVTPSRRKGVSAGSVVRIVAAVAVILALAVGGLYLAAEGKGALEKAGLGSLAKLFGGAAKEENAITLQNTSGKFFVNAESGEIFVVRGVALNNTGKSQPSIQVRAILYGPKGETVAQKSSFCGNILPDEQLAALPMAKIEETMGSQAGPSANLGIKPGKGVPFMVVFKSVPKEIAEFGVEVVGATPASR